MKTRVIITYLAIVLIVIGGGMYFFFRSFPAGNGDRERPVNEYRSFSGPTSMKISSPVFNNNEALPLKYTCDGDRINPSIQFDGVSETAQSLVLVVDDPDAPKGPFVHWLVWNIDPRTKEIVENSVPAKAVEGKNTAGRMGYFPPCPPSGTHHYVFRLYALDSALSLSAGAVRPELEKAMAGHVLEAVEITGLYRL